MESHAEIAADSPLYRLYVRNRQKYGKPVSDRVTSCDLIKGAADELFHPVFVVIGVLLVLVAWVLASVIYAICLVMFPLGMLIGMAFGGFFGARWPTNFTILIPWRFVPTLWEKVIRSKGGAYRLAPKFTKYDRLGFGWLRMYPWEWVTTLTGLGVFVFCLATPKLQPQTLGALSILGAIVVALVVLCVFLGCLLILKEDNWKLMRKLGHSIAKRTCFEIKVVKARR